MCLLLTACGFHLRGIQKLPTVLNRLYLQSSDPFSQLSQAIRLTLKSNRILLVQTPAEASATLRIISVEQTHKMTSLSGAAEAGQYTLFSKLTFEVTDSEKHVLLEPTTIQASRNYNSNAMQVLSAYSVRERLSKAMNQQLASDILSRLSKVKPFIPPKKKQDADEAQTS